jgi:hypothetical protein
MSNATLLTLSCPWLIVWGLGLSLLVVGFTLLVVGFVLLVVGFTLLIVGLCFTFWVMILVTCLNL